jgi:dedicator of cytokinesis protein 3
VAYFGKGFASNLRNREHIYCGLQLERLQDFVQRMLNKFPNATLMKSTDPPGDDIRESEAQVR